MELILRDAGAADAEAIAAIHTQSWQGAYRGILSDAYLDGPVLADMRAKWHDRMAAPPAGQHVWCADVDGRTIGFVCVMREDGTPWGALIDNLHLLPAARGHGAGKRLMGEAARWVAAQGITQLHLFVYEDNAAAIGFYVSQGGVQVSRQWLPRADGGHAWVHIYHWPRIATLAALR